MTILNNPNVKMVIGKVKRRIIGFKKIFTKPNTTATIKAEYRSSTATPAKR